MLLFKFYVNKMVKNHEYQKLYSMTRSSEQKEHELGELYANFDKVFLHLFPDFVKDLNSLLKPEAQIHLTDATKLPAMVRVFALIRLGLMGITHEWVSLVWSTTSCFSTLAAFFVLA